MPLKFERIASTLKELIDHFPQSKVIGLVAPGGAGGDVMPLSRLGLSGVLQVSTTLDDDLASAITTVVQGSIWVPEFVLREHSARVRALSGQLPLHSALSAREAQVLDSVIWGRSNREVASILGIAVRTVKFHASNILSKLGLDRRTELVGRRDAV